MRATIVTAVLFGFPVVATAQPDPKPAAQPLVTRVYDLKHVLAGKTGAADTDAVIKLIFESVAVGEVKPGGDGPRVVERDGQKLEVRAAKKVQGEIKDLLDALARLADLAIDIKADVIEFDRATFEKSVKPLFAPPKGRTDPPAAIGFGDDDEGEPKDRPKAEDVTKALKLGRLVQTSSRRYSNGVEAVLSSRQTVVPYTTHPNEALKVPGSVLYVKDGFNLVGLPVVSADRRFIRFKLTEQSSALVGERKRDFGEIAGQRFVMTSPVVEDFGRTATVEVGDGATAVFRLDYAPKDKVWLVVLRPRIFIQAEQDELKKQKK
jgi:hypothetical protein